MIAETMRALLLAQECPPNGTPFALSRKRKDVPWQA
jgi:hypothetical protein